HSITTSNLSHSLIPPLKRRMSPLQLRLTPAIQTAGLVLPKPSIPLTTHYTHTHTHTYTHTHTHTHSRTPYIHIHYTHKYIHLHTGTHTNSHSHTKMKHSTFGSISVSFT